MKIVCLALALCLGVLPLFGCKGGDTVDTSSDSAGSGESTPVSVDGTESEAAFEPIEFVSGGSSEFIIWVAAESYGDSDVMAVIAKINDEINKKTGVTLGVKSDADYRDSYASKPAILVGRTVFEESETLGADMRNMDYRVSALGNKIILCGYDCSRLITALNYLLNQIIKPQENANKTLFFTEKNIFMSDFNYGLGKVVLGGSELKDYRIVVPQNASVIDTLIANVLKRHLTDNYGYTLEIVDDSKEAFLEILIGNTARTDVAPKNGEFAIDFERGKLQLAANGIRGYEALEECLLSTFLKAGNKKEYTYADGYSYTAKANNILENGTVCATERLGDVRCMFYNVYGWIGYGPDDVRHDLQKELIRAYSPDVLCLQEYADFYHADFTKILTKLGYADASKPTSYINNTPLFYNTKTIELIDSGCHLFTGVNNSNTKSLTWAVLEVKASGERFIAISQHLMYDMKGLEDPNAVRVANINEAIAQINAIRQNAAYKDLPLIIGGDFNCYLDSDPQKLLASSGYEYGWDVAESKNDTKGLHSWSIWSDEHGMWTQIPAINGDHNNAIDHAFVDGDVTVKRYAAITSKVALWVSDHMPLIVDLDI